MIKNSEESAKQGVNKEYVSELRFLKLLNEVDERYLSEANKSKVIYDAFKIYLKVAVCFCFVLVISLLVFSFIPSDKDSSYRKVTLKGDVMPTVDTALFIDEDMCFLAYDNGGTYIYEATNEELELIDYKPDYFPANRALTINNGVLEVVLSYKENFEVKDKFVYKWG